MILFSLEAYSQTNMMMASVNSAGHEATGTSGSVTYSIGQVFYTYLGETVYNVAQGIQHGNTTQQTPEETNLPEDVDTTGDEVTTEDTPKIDIKIYPNPTTDFITITSKGLENQNLINSYQLFNYQGQLIMENSMSQVNTKINLNNLSTSMYILRVYIDQKLFKTFKILKK